MRVIINQNPYFLTKDKWFSDFARNTLLSVFHRHNDYEFLYLTYDSNNNIMLPQNVTSIKVFQPLLLPFFLRRWWYKRKIISLAKALKADAIISFQPFVLNTIMPEYVVALNGISDMNNIPSSIRIITSSIQKKELLQKKGLEESSIMLLRPFVDQNYTPLDFDSIEKIKAKYTEGKEFFLFEASNASDSFIIHVLKAFSVFKKWQLSNTKLVIINAELNNKTAILLDTYKHRHDIHIPDNAAEHDAALMASATALIYLPVSDNFGLRLAQALHAEVPVITHKTDVLEEIGGDAVLYTDAGDVQDIADKMMKLFKDEKLRNQAIKKGKTRAIQLQAETTFCL